MGEDNLNVENTMGKHGLGNRSENGEMLLDTCRTNNFVIGGTLFPHPRIHKVTWVSPDNKTENQIDHIIISRKWRTSLLDVRNKRGADIASDHHLLIGTLRIKLAAIKKDNQFCQRRFNVANLKNQDCASSYIRDLNTFLHPNYTASDNWNVVKNIFTDAAARHVGYKINSRKDWISDITWKLIQERKDAKASLNSSQSRSRIIHFKQLHNQLNRNVKHSARRDKRRWINNIAREAQAASETNRARDVYLAVKKITNSSISAGKPLKNDAGELVTSKKEQLHLWEQFYSDMFEPFNSTQQQICDCESHAQNSNISSSSPTVTEIRKAINTLKQIPWLGQHLP